MTVREEALAYLRSNFWRSWNSGYPGEGFYSRRAEAMRRARAVGCTYAAIGEAVNVCPERAKQIIVKAKDESQGVPVTRCYASEKGAIRAVVHYGSN